MGQSKDSVRLKAEQHYIENMEVTQKDLADLFGVRQATVGDWIKKYDWEQKRLNYHSSPTIIRQSLQGEAIRLINGEEPTFSADAMAKIVSAIDKVNKKADPKTVYEILKELDMFISERDPELAVKSTPYHKEFLRKKFAEI